MDRRVFVAALLSSLTASVLAPRVAFAQTEALPSWNDSPARAKISDFVARVTREGAPDYVRPSERIALFDNDGTLWTEQLYFQLAFVLNRVRSLAPQHPEWKSQQPYRALLAGDIRAALASGEKGLLALVGAVNEGFSVEEFEASVLDWLKTARHPRFGRLKLDKGLDEAARQGWPVVSMKRDWRTVFPAQK